MPLSSTCNEGLETTSAESQHLAEGLLGAVDPAVAEAVVAGLGASSPATGVGKSLPPWLFYDELGSQLFERITLLPEYYLTRTERDLLSTHAEEIFTLLDRSLTIVELGAGTATKTGILLRALTARQPTVLYQPIDISPSALEEAQQMLERSTPGLSVRPQVANYIVDPIHIDREPHSKVLALYIGSSIGNFSPAEARGILVNLREQLQPGDALLLGTDRAPSTTGADGEKSIATLLAAYDDASGITAAFNRNILIRLNRELSADFDLDRFDHHARWNADESRIEMHLVSTCAQSVRIPATRTTGALRVPFAAGETIHTENSYKFSSVAIAALLEDSGFRAMRSFSDAPGYFAVTLASAV